MIANSEDAERTIAAVARRAPDLRLLVLFGSRARSDARAGSDWDFAYEAGTVFDPDALLLALVDALGTERIDLVDLARAGGLVRYRAARDGRPLFSSTPDAFERFAIEAVTFWCDVAPVLEAGYADVLSELDR
ncbi:MAG: nucleotidyltransferase domain-containing protein [Candidatus Rokubacteria bacterium]|nr:nucleotidyltransferase domain-containing protein [Candidatus Rokubacteria bacterium]